jgi:hypothetical protein
MTPVFEFVGAMTSIALASGIDRATTRVAPTGVLV